MQNNMRLKPSNDFIEMTEIKFLGHIFDVSGVRLSDESVQGIKESSEQTSVKWVRSFIGPTLPISGTLFKAYPII